MPPWCATGPDARSAVPRRWRRSSAATSQTTFVGVAVREGHLYGACAGNSRAYLVGEAGVRILTEESSPRLGSGRAQPTAVHVRLAPRDVVLLMSDGAWTPLSMAAIQRCVAASAMKHPPTCRARCSTWPAPGVARMT